MSNVLNRETMQYLVSVNDPDYPTTSWVHNPDLSGLAGVDSKYWIIDPDDTVREMTVAEKDAAVATWRAERKGELLTAVNEYGAGRYSEINEMRLKHIYNRAIADGLTARAAYVKAALDWSDIVTADWQTRDAALTAATTHAAVMAVSLDFSGHDAADPVVTVSGALVITT